MQAVGVAFLGMSAGGAVLVLAWGPTVTPYRLLGFLGCLFVLTGAVAVAVILWASGRGSPPLRGIGGWR